MVVPDYLKMIAATDFLMTLLQLLNMSDYSEISIELIVNLVSVVTNNFIVIKLSYLPSNYLFFGIASASGPSSSPLGMKRMA